MKYSDVPSFTRESPYHVNVGWEYAKDKLSVLKGRTFDVELIPDFQRGHVWNKKQKREYVEFKIKGGSGANALLWNCPGWMDTFNGPYQFVDGLQRFSAVQDFLNNKFKAFDSFYKDFEGCLPSHCEFIWHVNCLKTRKEVLTWYIELNAGGVVHSDKEINRVKALLNKET